MVDLANPHDRFFKEIFSQNDIASDFLQHYLPANFADLLNFSSMHIIKDTFVDKELQEYYSDLLYKLNLKDGRGAFVYVLFEHKSYPDSLVAFQLLRYMVKIWEYGIRQGERLSPILPVVIYHGEAKWHVGKSFHDLFDTSELFKHYLPEYQYWLCDLSQYKDEELKGAVILRVALLVLKYIFSEDLRQQLPKIFTLLHDLSKRKSGLEYLEVILRYLNCATEKINEDDLKEAVSAVFPEGGVIMSTIAQKWVEQGIQEGIQQGIQQGIQKGVRQGILDAIELGLEIKFGVEGLRELPEIRKIKDVDVLHAIREAIKTVKTINELRSIYQ